MNLIVFLRSNEVCHLTLQYKTNPPLRPYYPRLEQSLYCREVRGYSPCCTITLYALIDIKHNRPTHNCCTRRNRKLCTLPPIALDDRILRTSAGREISDRCLWKPKSPLWPGLLRPDMTRRLHPYWTSSPLLPTYILYCAIDLSLLWDQHPIAAPPRRLGKSLPFDWGIRRPYLNWQILHISHHHLDSP
jgi:hypothetical protein